MMYDLDVIVWLVRCKCTTNFTGEGAPPDNHRRPRAIDAFGAQGVAPSDNSRQERSTGAPNASRGLVTLDTMVQRVPGVAGAFGERSESIDKSRYAMGHPRASIATPFYL